MRECPNCQHLLPEDAQFCPACQTPIEAAEDDVSFEGHVLNDKYELIHKIAEGGMAMVYKAKHTMLDDDCAVKIIKRSLANKDEMLKRFKREAKLTRQVARRSPYIISIYDFGTEEGVGFFYVMELLNGRPFAELLYNPMQPPDPLQTVRFVGQICEALHVVHEEGLVHRDIKPDNIFLHKEQHKDEEIIKLLDFGIARPTYAKATMLTNYGRVMGTPEYMSPEQCRGPTPQQYERGESHLDGRSDIYSLGVLLYQCLTGEVPFPMAVDGGPMAIHKVMAGHVMEDPVSPADKRPDLLLPPALCEATLRSLAKEADDRFANMLLFRDALYACFPELSGGSPSMSSGEIETQGVSTMPEVSDAHLQGVPLSEAPTPVYLEVEESLRDVSLSSVVSPAPPLVADASISASTAEQVLDRTAMDVQLPPSMLEELRQWGQNAEVVPSAGNVLAEPVHPSAHTTGTVDFDSNSSWEGQGGQGSAALHEGFDGAKTLASELDPETIQELRKQAEAVAAAASHSDLAPQQTPARSFGANQELSTAPSPWAAEVQPDSWNDTTDTEVPSSRDALMQTSPLSAEVVDALKAHATSNGGEFHYDSSAKTDRNPALERPNKSRAWIWVLLLFLLVGAGAAWFFLFQS